MTAPSAIPAGSQANAAFLPAPELPRGGLAVHGMGEHWSVNTQTGGLSVSVPLATSPGRGASRADLSLNYTGGGRVPHHVRRFRPRTDDTRTRIERCAPADQGPGPLPRLVRTIEFGHDATLSRLTSLRHVGYQWNGAAYDTVALPPVEFGYIDPVPASAIRDIALPAQADGAHVHFVNLRSEGLPGVLSTTPGGWWYRPPAGDGGYDPPEVIAQLPPTGSAGTTGMRDVDGTGRVGIAAETGGLAGSSVRQPDGSWDSYRAYATRAVADLADPRLQRLDITGDGLPDLLTRGADALRWTESLGRDGYGRTRLVPSAAAETAGPCPPADDIAHEWFSADMSGDGLPDLVRVISTWQIELPTAYQQFDYDTISDLILHVRYTAREGGAAFRTMTEKALGAILNETVLVAGRKGLYVAFSVRASYPITIDGTAATLTRDPTMTSRCVGPVGTPVLGSPVTISCDASKLQDLTVLISYTVS